MARVYEIGAHLLAVVDSGDVPVDPKRLCFVRVILRDGTKHKELTDVARCAALEDHLKENGAGSFRKECAVLPVGSGVPYDAIGAVEMWDNGAMTQLGNGGFAFYLPAARTIWSRWGEFVRGLSRDLPLDGEHPLAATEFALLVGEKLDRWTVDAWLRYERISVYRYRKQLGRLRVIVDAMQFHWILAKRHPPAWQFVRGNLPETETPVIAFLKTDEGMRRVLDYIVTTGDPQFLRERQPPRALH